MAQTVQNDDAKRSREPRTAYTQYEAMLGYMQDHPDFAHGRLLGVEGRKSQKSNWVELATNLNSDPLGPKKSGDRWEKVWRDWKCAVRKKKALQIAHLNGTGGGGPSKILFTDIEDKLLAFLTPIAVVGEARVLEAGFLAVEEASADPETNFQYELPIMMHYQHGEDVEDCDSDDVGLPVESATPARKRKQGPASQAPNSTKKMSMDKVRTTFVELQSDNAAAMTSIGTALHSLAAAEVKRAEADENKAAALTRMAKALEGMQNFLSRVLSGENLDK